jgi:hypothetical protein
MAALAFCLEDRQNVAMKRHIRRHGDDRGKQTWSKNVH